MASLMLFVLALLLLLVTCSDGMFSYAYGETQLLSLKKLPFTHHTVSCFSPKSSKRVKGGIVLEMKHKDYCHGRHAIDREKTSRKHLMDDQIRVESIQSHIRKAANTRQIEGADQARVPLGSGVKLQTLNYVVTINLGGQNRTVIVDTGSDLTWVQCQPCRLCYNQPEPLFNPSISPSYQSLPCNSSACSTLQSATGNSPLCGKNAPTCNYVVSYGDGSYTRGELAKENLLLGSTPVPDFAFGCGRNNKGLFGSASGLMGLGRSDLSFISQTFNLFGGVFSYCLPSTEPGASGSLTFGTDSKNSTPFLYTPLVQNPQLSIFYILNLTGVTIGGVPVQEQSFGKNGILIDSGTVISRLPPSIYGAVKSEFLKQFSGFPPAPGFSILDTCFDLSAYDEVNVPDVKFQFDGNAELSVDASGTLYFVKSDASQVCLALASLTYEDEIGIIGNYQQRNTRVLYDTKQGRVAFAKETCSFT